MKNIKLENSESYMEVIQFLSSLDADKNRELFYELDLINKDINAIFNKHGYDEHKFGKKYVWMIKKINYCLKHCSDVEDLNELKELYKKYADIKNKIIEGNLKIVLAVASRYHMIWPISLDEIIQYGNIGLMKAVEKYDVHKGETFATYAFCWIWGTICHGVGTIMYTTNVPFHIREKYHKMVKIQDVLYQELGREPSAKEMSQYMGMSEEKVKEMMDCFVGPIYMSDMVLKKTNMEFKEVMVQDVVTEDTDFTRDITNDDARIDFINKIKCILTKNEFEAIIKYYGFGDRCYTNQEIADILDITPQRVDQLKQSAIKKIRKKPNIINMLYD